MHCNEKSGDCVESPEHLIVWYLKFGCGCLCCMEITKLLPGLSPNISAWIPTAAPELLHATLSLQSIFHSAARAIVLKPLMQVMSLSVPNPPKAPHFFWSKNQSPHWPKTLPDLATPSPPAFVTSDLIFYFSFPSATPLASLASLPFLTYRVSQFSPTDILGRIILCYGRLSSHVVGYWAVFLASAQEVPVVSPHPPLDIA